MTRTVLVTGSTGLLGRAVLKEFQRSGWVAVGHGFSRGGPEIIKANLEKPEEVDKLLNEAKPQVIVHCAANRSPDSCDANPQQARSINVDATRALAKAAAAQSVLLIYISTDYVFPGRPGEAPYEVTAETQPPNFYGQTKLDGELVTLEETLRTGLGVVLRVPVLYGHADKHSDSAVNVLVDAVWKAAKDAHAGVKMDDWAQRYPTNTEDVGRVCVDIAAKYLGEADRASSLPKVLQFSSEDRMTKYQICQRLAAILGVPIPGMVANKEGNDPNAKVQRPYDTHLSTKVLKELGINVNTQSFDAWWRRELRATR